MPHCVVLCYNESLLCYSEEFTGVWFMKVSAASTIHVCALSAYFIGLVSTDNFSLTK